MEPTADSTLVVILGASEFPKATELGANSAFRESAKGVRDYFLARNGFQLPKANLLDLFDAGENFSELDEKVGSFLRERAGALDLTGTGATDLVVYYVGHGAFAAGTSQYFLAIRATRADNDYHTSYAIKALARTLKEHAPALRKYLILDSCFAASAAHEFQGPVLTAVGAQIMDELPSKGTALLCASGPREAARAPEGAKYTMFSEALIDVLNAGALDKDVRLSLSDVHQLTSARIRALYDEDGVRPQVHCPEQSSGDVTNLPFFPNAALSDVARTAKRLAELEARVSVLQGSLASQSRELSTLEGRVGPLEVRPTSIVLPSMDASTREPASIRRDWAIYDWAGMTREAWEELPAHVKGEVFAHLAARRNGLVWLTSLAVLNVPVWICVLLPESAGRLYGNLAFSVCWCVAGIVTVWPLWKRARGLEYERSGSADEPEPWGNHDAIVAARAYRAVDALPGIFVGAAPYWAGLAFCYVTAVVALSQRFGLIAALTPGG